MCYDFDQRTVQTNVNRAIQSVYRKPQAWEKQMQSAMRHRGSESQSAVDMDEDSGEQVDRDAVANPRKKILVTSQKHIM